MPDTQGTPLPIDVAVKVTGFARACKAAARAVSLYPAEHPAIREALGRLSKAAADATAAGQLTLLVLPNNLLVDGHGIARPDAAVCEFAALLHAHMVGELCVARDVDATSWRVFLKLLAESPDDVHARGGISRAWTTAGGYGLELHELDYSDLLRSTSTAHGQEATWDAIIAHCLEGNALDLDEHSLQILSEIASDPMRLGDFFARTAENAKAHADPQGRAGALLRALRGVTGFFEQHESTSLDRVLDNMATATARLSPEVLMELLGVGRDSKHEMSSLARQVTERITDSTVAEFVANAFANERRATTRLADAFRSLVFQPARKKAVLNDAHARVQSMPIGAEPDFERMWSQVEDMLVSYTDTGYIHETYDAEMSRARERASELHAVADDPPERIAAWLTTVSDDSVRSQDLRLLLDLIRVETDASERQSLLKMAMGQVDELLGVGDFDSSRMLIEGIAAAAQTHPDADARTQASKALELFATSDFVAEFTPHLVAITDDEFDMLHDMCIAVGNRLVPRLAETLSTADLRPKARQRLTDLLLGFGSQGRQSIEQLILSSNPAVRRTAVQLLRSLGGNEALGDLEGLLEDSDPSVQRDAVRALIGIGSAKAFELLQRALLGGSAGGVGAIVTDELASTRDPRAVALFCHIVRNVSSSGATGGIYDKAVARLGSLGGEDAVAALAEVFARGSWLAPFRSRSLWEGAAQALAQIRLPSAANALRKAAEEGRMGVRGIAKRYLR